MGVGKIHVFNVHRGFEGLGIDLKKLIIISY